MNNLLKALHLLYKECSNEYPDIASLSDEDFKSFEVDCYNLAISDEGFEGSFEEYIIWATKNFGEWCSPY